MALCTGGSDRYVRGFTGGGIDEEGDRSPRGAFDDLRNPGAIIIYLYGQVVPRIIQFPECGLNEVVTVFYRIELFPGPPYFPEVSRVPVFPEIGSVIRHLHPYSFGRNRSLRYYCCGWQGVRGRRDGRVI